MSTSQRVNRGFHRPVFLAVIRFGFVLSLITSAQADEQKAQLARLMYSAFMFASLAERKEESVRLANVGVDAGHAFFEALQNGKISKEEMNSTVPLSVY